MELITCDRSHLMPDTDTNNNKKSEMYSLRQRNKKKMKNSINANHNPLGYFETLSDTCDSGNHEEQNILFMKKGLKEGKAKAAPLSKYRRKTANARERTRMREINCAFELLRQCVPVSITGVETPSNNEKLTKITTLRLAMKYIRILSEILNKCEKITLNKNNGENTLYNTSILDYQEIYNDILNDTVFKPTVTKPTGGRKELKKQCTLTTQNKIKKSPKPRKKYTKKQEKKIKVLEKSKNIGTDEECFANFGLPLESDSDSLHFSEACVDSFKQIKQWPRQDNLNNLGLLLESDGESLELSEPCFSPLSHLDSINNLNDLLKTGFSESSTLEIFLA